MRGRAENPAGTSAMREYERRRAGREARARSRLGALGALIARASAEPQSTQAWRHGARAEIDVAAQLERHLRGRGVVILHDRRIPGRGNIDHLAVGPGGITVIDTKGTRGHVQLKRVGGFLSPRRELLLVGGRDCTRQLDGIERQTAAVKRTLARAGLDEVPVAGALCYPYAGGIPARRALPARRGTIAIARPRAVAKLAWRAGPLAEELVHELAERLARGLPPA